MKTCFNNNNRCTDTGLPKHAARPPDYYRLSEQQSTSADEIYSTKCDHLGRGLT